MNLDQMLEIIERIDEKYEVSLDSSDVGPGEYKNMEPAEFEKQAILAARYLRQKQGKPPIDAEAGPGPTPIPERKELDISEITDPTELARIWEAQGSPMPGPREPHVTAPSKVEELIATARAEREEVRVQMEDYTAKRQARLKALRAKRALEKAGRARSQE